MVTTLLLNAVNYLRRSEGFIKIVLLIVQDTLPASIKPGLYLGIIAYAKSREIITKLNIKYILSVTSARYRPIIPADINNKLIYLKDWKHENIIIYFPEVYNFINKALSKRERITGKLD